MSKHLLKLQKNTQKALIDNVFLEVNYNLLTRGTPKKLFEKLALQERNSTWSQIMMWTLSSISYE